MAARILAVLLAASSLGCGPSETIVWGTVTVNHQPLSRGYVTFFPLEGAKGAKGAPVTDGQFTIRKIPPGQWKALISATPDVQLAQNPHGPTILAIAPNSLAISPQTPGNQPIVEIRSGKQTLDFTLEIP